MTKVLFTDCVYQALFIWQLVYLFGWACLSTIDTSCVVVPLLSYYLIGVGLTSIIVFIVVMAEVVTADNTVYTQHELGHQRYLVVNYNETIFIIMFSFSDSE